MSDQNLSDFVSSVCDESHLRVETDFGDGFVRLLSEEAERRQAAHDIRSTEDALIELLRNSRDAHARNIFVASTKNEQVRNLVVLDDGEGIPAHMHELIFEPRVTSKLDSVHFDKWGVHGRGMALYSIKVNAQSAQVMASSPEKGTSLLTSFALSHLQEKTDQSTFPSFSLQDDKSIQVKGPKNLLRMAAEFAFEQRNDVSVYYGSISEIAATLYAYGSSTLSIMDRTFASGTSDIPIVKRLALAADEETFCDVARDLGLDMSERTARRILMGEIRPVHALFDVIQMQLFQQMNASSPQYPKKNPSKAVHGPSAPKISKDDLQVFSESVMSSYKDIADTYYLSDHVNPVVTVKKDGLHLFIPFVESD